MLHPPVSPYYWQNYWPNWAKICCMGVISFWFSWATTMKNNLRYYMLKFQGWLKLAQYLLIEFFGFPSLASIIFDNSQSILEILVPILLQIFWIFEYAWFWKSKIRKYGNLSQPQNLTINVEIVTEWLNDNVTMWPCDRVTDWPSDQVTKLRVTE